MAAQSATLVFERYRYNFVINKKFYLWLKEGQVMWTPPYYPCLIYLHLYHRQQNISKKKHT